MSEAKETTTATNETAKREKLKPVTVRFTGEAWEVLHDVAADNHITAAELIRLCVDNRLAAYLQTVDYIDAEQGAAILAEKRAIRETLLQVYNEMAAVRLELNRIGVNFNQEVKRRNILQKYAGTMDVAKLMEKQKELEKLDAESQGFDADKMADLITRYEQATQKAGDILCRIAE